MRISPARWLAVVVFFALAGCAASPPSRFYVLSPVASDTTAPPTVSAPAIGVGPVELPDYLGRPEIVVRSGAYELRYNETQRWAETLRDNVTSVLA